MKLPILLVSAAAAAWTFLSGSKDILPDVPRTATSDRADTETTSSPLALDDNQQSINLTDIARDIRSLKQRQQPKVDRVASDPIAPLLLSQAKPSSPALSGEATETRDSLDNTPPTEVDESALRYFAARGDTARLAAEIARLRLLYPNWTPPADPLAVPENTDRQIEELWELYAEGRYPEVRKALVERQAAEANWQPPQDLLDRLEIAEARTRLTNASDLKQYQTVISIGASHSSLLNCSEVDVLWRVADAFGQTDRQERAVDAYTYILTNCTDPDERIATLQKAASLLPYVRVQPLFALEKSTDAGREFDSIRNELARRFVAEANEEPTLEIAPEYVERLATLAKGDGSAADALLLGWYYLRRDDTSEAAIWFRHANERDESADASQGLALTLLETGKPAEAEAVLYRWRDSSDDAIATYLAATANLLAVDPAPMIENEVLSRMAQAVTAERYAPAAQQFGWYARNFDQPQTAAKWFEMALQWSPEDEPSAYGLALTRLQLNDRAGFSELQQQWRDRSARIADLAKAQAGQPSERSAPARQRVGTSARPPNSTSAEIGASAATVPTTVVAPARRSSCTGRLSASRLSPAAALARGWCLMDLNRPLEAAESFEVAIGSGNRSVSEDGTYGQSLAYLRLGLTDRAAVAATKAPMSAERAREVQTSILADRAIHAYGSDRYRETLLYLDQRAQIQPETVDLMVLRGYSYMNLNRPYDALRLFEAAAATGSRDASRGLADAKAAIDGN